MVMVSMRREVCYTVHDALSGQKTVWEKAVWEKAENKEENLWRYFKSATIKLPSR